MKTNFLWIEKLLKISTPELAPFDVNEVDALLTSGGMRGREVVEMLRIEMASIRLKARFMFFQLIQPYSIPKTCSNGTVKIVGGIVMVKAPVAFCFLPKIFLESSLR
jgi:hypothetical protein